MTKFRIMPHGRLQEWVAEEKGYYKDEGLDYEFVASSRVGIPMAGASVTAADGVNHLVDGHVQAANLFGVQHDIVEQLGFRKVLDTSFMIGFLVGGDASVEQCHQYFNALRRAQCDIDLEPEQYKHYFERDVP